MPHHLIPSTVIMCFGVFVKGQADDSSQIERAYVVLEKQNLGKTQRKPSDVRPVRASGDGVTCLYWVGTILMEPFLAVEVCFREAVCCYGLCVFVLAVTLGSVFAVLLLLMVVMAVCVYKPQTRR